MSLTSNVNEKANLIWAIADKLTGIYKPHEYGEVILPLTVIRRFDCLLADTKDKVLAKADSIKKMPEKTKDVLLRKAAGHDFYNTSKYDFEKLVDDPDNIEANFRNYLNGFSDNVAKIIQKFNFDVHIAKMAEKGILYIVIKEFTSPQANLHPKVISNLEMGYIFEEIIRRFSEAHNEDAGQHYTPREVIRLMVNIIFNDDSAVLAGDNVVRTLYDPACGTGGMLSVADDYLHSLNKTATLIPFGQEINDQTFAICKADMLIKGNDADQIRDGNTLSDDQFPDIKFDYILSNPPFGREWKNEKTAVMAEAAKGFAGRFAPGLPAVGDSQMLFLLTAISKMKDSAHGGSRIAIIHNGSPLFTGDAGSGPSEIRKYILEHDLLEAIIALPNDIFYNTGIATYIWVLSNKKAPFRKGKVQLINANGLFEKRRKSLGNKRNDIPQSAIDEITRLYGDFKETEISKIFNNEDFGYSKITVERPLRLAVKIDSETLAQTKKLLTLSNVFVDNEGVAEEEALTYALNNPKARTIAIADTPKQKQAKAEIRTFYKTLVELKREEPYYDLVKFGQLFTEKAGLKFDDFYQPSAKFNPCTFIVTTDPQAEIIKDKKGKPVPDANLRDTENVPLTENIETYFKREVLPFAPDAWIDKKKTTVGYEIPFTRYFYKYVPPKSAADIAQEIKELENGLDDLLAEVFAK